MNQADQVTLDRSVAAKKVDKIEITSDGTRAGTVIKVNGKEVKNLSTANFYFYNDSYSDGVSFSMTTKESKPEAGSLCEQTYFRLVPPKAIASMPECHLQQQAPSDIPANMLERSGSESDIYRRM